ncbi:MAG: type II toxin-antitoxin system HicB family antitoxin [Patescibacteria group bacterium]
MKSAIRKTQVRHAERLYPVVVQEEEAGGYWVTCPAFEGCYSQGSTVDEALKNVREAIELCEAELPKVPVRQYATNVSLHLVRV